MLDGLRLVFQEIAEPALRDHRKGAGFERHHRCGARLLVETIPLWEAGKVVPRAQDNSAATFCKPLVKADADIKWESAATEIERQWRANTPWPGCHSFWNGRQVRFLRLDVVRDWMGIEPPGTVFLLPEWSDNGSRLGISTGHGAIRAVEIQLAGKRAMGATEFLRGQPDFVGARLAGSQPVVDTKP